MAYDQEILEVERGKAMRRFELAKEAGVLAGTFSDESWKFKSRWLRFSVFSSRNFTSLPEVGLSETSMLLAKSFVTYEISRSRSLAADTIYGRLVAFRALAVVIQEAGASWNEVQRWHLDDVVARLNHSRSAKTVYHRAEELGCVVEYLNKVKVGSGKAERRFLPRYLKWSHGLRHPDLELGDPTSEASNILRERRYLQDLPSALAQVRAATINSPSIEPSPGYDMLRIEAQAFMLALGIRVGEVLSLPVHALDEQSVPGSLFLRVSVEKGSEAAAVPVPAVWEEVVRAAYLYFLEFCGPARARARQIESYGFAFVGEALQIRRQEFPLSAGGISQIRLAGLSLSEHFLVGEVTRCFALSDNAFLAKGRYRKTIVEVPKPVTSRVVRWIDQRFAFWDWARYGAAKLCAAEGAEIGLKDIAEALGLRLQNMSKNCWCSTELHELLVDMSSKGAFNHAFANDPVAMNEWMRRWLLLRRRMMSKKGGTMGMVVSLSAFKEELSKQFAGYLNKHFDEIIHTHEEEDEVSRPNQAMRPRAGMERRLSDHLIVVWDGQFSGDRGLGIVPRPMSRRDLYQYLSAKSGKHTIFERLNIRERSGEVVSLTPHMIRHWVTTAMLRSGSNEAAVDMWMNRAPRQGRHYDHRTAKERAEAVRSVYMASEPPSDYLGRRVQHWRNANISEEEIQSLISEKLRVVHISPWGSCSRDLYTSPCNRGLMCLRGFGTNKACSYFQVDVDDQEARAEIERLLAENERIMRALEPQFDSISDALREELKTSHSLDQHVMYVMDVIRGCRSALETYQRRGDQAENGS